MARGRKKPFGIRGMAATPYKGGGAGQANFGIAKKQRGIKMHKGHGSSRHQRKISSGRM